MLRPSLAAAGSASVLQSPVVHVALGLATFRPTTKSLGVPWNAGRRPVGAPAAEASREAAPVAGGRPPVPEPAWTCEASCSLISATLCLPSSISAAETGGWGFQSLGNSGRTVEATLAVMVALA